MYKQKNDFLDPYLESKCPVCGGTEFEWGRLGGQTYYVPGESMWRWRGYKFIRTRRCVQCNNLLQFADESLTKQQNKMIVWIVGVVVFLVLLGAILPFILMSAK